MLTILIADDEREEREGIAFLIDEYDFELNVLFADDGRTALSCLKQQHVDILFTDIRMPFMEGLPLISEAIKLYPKLKIILFSGFSEFEYAKKAMSLGVSDYILKPVNVDEFRHVMETVIEKINTENQEEELLFAQQEYVKKHILLCAINKTLVNNNFPVELMNYLFHRYKRIMLLQFDKNFFETAGTEFEQKILSYINVPADYLNVTLCQSLLLFHEDENYHKISFYEIGSSIYDQILSVYNQNCYISISREIKSIEDLASAYSRLEQLLECRFFMPKTFIFDETAQQSEENYNSYETSTNREAHLVKQYVEKHYNEDLYLEILASKVYISPRYLSTIFKKYVGCGLNKYIKTIRMRKAKELLKNTNIKVIDICKMVGYHNLSYFCQNFHEFYGETPEKYRQKGLQYLEE
ncbi:response regulator [Clostridium oryzae]|uniref:Stage 0 sporulation protein A homolog n=1 Tax=Clostridium oryzae TaxID=1450648 RepID=A0A1V4IJL6_9CLOT|nr:response regulator [Clostridium oryzae]OPJ60024.1 putative response regulatory protein [Clostridium oryzae]